MKPRRFDLSPDNFIAGVAAQLTPDELGVYWMICLLIYSHGGPIEHDEVRLTGLFRKGHWRTVRAAIARLQELGKITSSDGHLMASGCSEPLDGAFKRVQRAHENGGKGGRPSNESKGLAKPAGSRAGKLARVAPPPPPPPPPPEDKKDSPDGESRPPAPPDTPDAVPLDPVEEMVAVYNETARDLSLATVARVTPARRRKALLRLAEVGGIEGWRGAMGKVRDSPFLRGDGPRGWRADFDFLMQAESLLKLMEGGYDDHGSAANGGARKLSATESLYAGAAIAIERREAQRRADRGEDYDPSGPLLDGG